VVGRRVEYGSWGRSRPERDATAPVRRITLQMVDNHGDAVLIRAACGGDHDAAAALFRRHWQPAWRVAYGITGRRAMADDIAADAFERAFSALNRFDRRRPFAPWLHRIVVNRALDLLRAERRLVGGELGPERAAEPELDGGDAELLDAVRALPMQRRAVIILRYGVGMTPTEIARILDLPIGTVNSRLARALEQLRGEYEGCDAERA
jgi:RNA polymerase sigma-70 factor (ECF subfamily)